MGILERKVHKIVIRLATILCGETQQDYIKYEYIGGADGVTNITGGDRNTIEVVWAC